MVQWFVGCRVLHTGRHRADRCVFRRPNLGFRTVDAAHTVGGLSCRQLLVKQDLQLVRTECGFGVPGRVIQPVSLKPENSWSHMTVLTKEQAAVEIPVACNTDTRFPGCSWAPSPCLNDCLC